MKFFFSSSDAIFETRDYCTLVCKIRNEAALTQMLTQNRKNACGNNGADGMQFSLVGGQRAANGAERTGNPVPSAPDVSSHAGGRWFESISLHQLPPDSCESGGFLLAFATFSVHLFLPFCLDPNRDPYGNRNREDRTAPDGKLPVRCCFLPVFVCFLGILPRRIFPFIFVYFT